MSNTTPSEPASPDVWAGTSGYVESTARGPHRLVDYLALPDDPRVELIEGRYYLSPAPIVLHQVVSAELLFRLQLIAKAEGGIALAAPCDLVLADDSVVQPDVVYYAASRREPLGPRLTTPPDLAIEILSPGNPSRDRVLKSRLYAEHGVAEYWIVDPAENSFEFLVLVDGKYQLQPQTEPRYASQRSPELVIDLADFWSEVARLTAPAS